MTQGREEEIQAYTKLMDAMRQLNQAIEHEQLGEIRKVWIPVNTALMEMLSQLWLTGAKQADQVEFIECLVRLEDISEHRHDHMHIVKQALNNSAEDESSEIAP